VIKVSSSRFEKYGPCLDPRECEDESGELIIGLLEKAGHRAVYRSVEESPPEIARMLTELLKSADAAILSGGTGLTRGDVTVEAVAPLLEKVMPGFGELFRMKSYGKIGASAVLTRAMAGVVDGRAVFCIPGSPDAAGIALREIILPELGHIIAHARRE
jgi:molybdenum cofactor biosynthesis protein B